jgi:two-component system sensor histidine kinase ChvG
MALRLPSRISVRLLAFNILILFVPIGGVLFLDTYERHLLMAQERTMAQEGRLLAAALEARDRLTGEDAQRILLQLGQRHLSRLRVISSGGELLADSALLGPRREPEEPDAAPAPALSPPQTNLLYRIGSLPFRLLRQRPVDVAAAAETDVSVDLAARPEVQSALGGRYGAATRISAEPRRSVTLHIAIPIRVEGAVEGAVLVSQSTTRILQALDAVRLDVLKVFLLGLGAAVVLSLLAATTIARPLAALRRRAGDLVDRRGRLRGMFTPSARRDEIGELERALAELTRQLDEHLRATEAFAADVSHEFKNPLAAIRTATDMALEDVSPEERRRFLLMIQKDVARMERLLTETRDISRIDARLDEEEPVEVRLDHLLPALVESFRLRLNGHGPELELVVREPGAVAVEGSPDRLTQVFENLIDNAVSFSPPGARVQVSLAANDDQAVVEVADEGPGIPAEHRDRVFARFYSYRPGEAGASTHTGLGLALVRAIIGSHGGSVRAAGREGPGTAVIVTLPLAGR